MFNNLRRPVPSKAALQVLYQLAYISSGTAVGIATLCTEERRRQAKILQKIADNAKRIRQSPRYVHSAAKAARREESGEEQQELMQYAPMDQPGDEQDQVLDGSKRRSVRDSDLPSAVDRGYEQLAGRDHKRTRRRRRSGQDIEGNTGAGAELCQPRNIDPPLKSCTDGGVVRRVGARADLINVYGTGRHGTGIRFEKQIEEGSETNVPSLFKDIFNGPKQGYRRSSGLDRITPRSLSHEIDVFFQTQPWSPTGFPERKMARVLFFDAIACGTFKEIRAIYRWMLARGEILQEHLMALCDAGGGLADRSDHQELFEFFRQLFETDEFRSLEPRDRVRGCFSLVVETMSWTLDLSVTFRCRILCKSLHNTPPAQMFDVVEESVEKLLDAKDVARATRWQFVLMSTLFRLFKAPRLERQVQKDRSTKLSNRIFLGALEHGHLFPAARHVERLLCQDPGNATVALEKFALASAQHDSYARLSGFLSLEDLRWQIESLVPFLSDAAKVAVARACILDRKHPLQGSLFNTLYSALPAALRHSLAEARTGRLLLDHWRITHDFAATWEEYTSARDFARDNGTTELRNAVDAAMIDICNAARRPDQALQLLSELNQRTPHSSRTLSMAAVSLAQKNAWSRIKKLVDLMATSGTFVQDGTVSRCLDNIIRDFARQHTPADTWKFVTSLIEKLHFAPTWATTQIVLRAFVRNNHLSFVSHWIRYLKTMGHQFKMDARTAASLMNAYYLEQRPPHALVMWFCRTITHLVPSFDAAAFERVMTEAIAYDLRKSKLDLREKAEKDFAVLQQSKGFIPKPFNELREAPPSSPVLEAKQFRSSTDPGFENDQVHSVPSGHASQGNSSTATSTADESYENLIRDFHDDSGSFDHLADHHSNIQSQGHVTEDADSFVQNLEGETDQDRELSQYLLDLEADETAERTDRDPAQRIEREILTAFSLKHYQEALDIYRTSRSAAGRPVSPQALEVAVEASLRLCRGDRAEALDIISEARKAGMDTTRAMQPILLHHMWHLRPDEKRDANSLRMMVMDWDRENEAKGRPVNNHIGVTAANILINNHWPEHGINLLSDLSRSERVKQKPFDITAMTVFLKGYAALRSAKGISWTIQTVLKKDMRIDRKFLDTIKQCAKLFEVTGVSRTGKPNTRPNHLRARLRQWRLFCTQRRTQQRQATKVFGRNLVKFISKLANESSKPVIDTDIRKELDGELFGASAFHESSTGAISLEKRRRLRRTRMRVAREIRWNQGPRHEGRRTADITRDAVWVQQYRAFLRRDVVMPDGKLASFRYRLANVPRRKYRRVRESRSAQPILVDEDVGNLLDVTEGNSPSLPANMRCEPAQFQQSEQAVGHDGGQDCDLRT
ncbi:hypothetical protein PRZ48_006184 [Zasmidium cellare]|uniref:Pentatricopeptide repeat-containing protein n=1 Tax=Zasmidium cellare TaxID=395010 RepID=A0ABR0ENI4_ZASCE|nr:hypothetical protein PRZ48_006184 [Zasmidium cellare]